MGIHYYDLQTAALIQERHSLSLEKCSQLTKRSASAIKRSIGAVNEYLPPDKQILLTNNQAVFQMTYKEYLQFIKTLTLDDYYPSLTERLDIMAVYAFFNLTLNMTYLYETLHFSSTTKKKDSRALSEWLSSQDLDTEIVPKTGIRIIGDELQFRICICNILSQYIEVEQNFSLSVRLANNPIQSMIVKYFLVKADQSIIKAQKLLTELVRTCHFRISYVSIKFLYLYLGCAQFRIHAGFTLDSSKSLPVTTNDYQLIDLPHENTFLNHLISSLDFTTTVMPPFNERLYSISKQLIGQIQKQIITWICDDHFIYEEVYAYLHKCMIRNTYHFSFYDNKLEETKQYYNNLYDVVKSAICLYEETYDTSLSHFQIASLTLIFRKFINRNKLAGRNQKKLVIVTNSSIEKIDFFMERLKLRVDVRLIDVIHMNELYLLRQIEYDYLVAFSNRIVTLLNEWGYSCLKLNFYPTEDDFMFLENLGFSTSKRKIKAKPFVQEIQGMDEEQLTEYLLDKYSDYFLE